MVIILMIIMLLYFGLAVYFKRFSAMSVYVLLVLEVAMIIGVSIS